ncbi:MAG: lipocalin family protein [Bacteroidales bacterium]|nr:lipocalin family protein [Bacteroidales bacterium]
MKRILYIIAAALMVISCGDKKNGGNTTELTLEQKLYGEWHSTKLAIDADIYISFMENGKFEMYQQIGEGAHRVFRGTWNLEDDLLSGKYNDGEEWAAAYRISVEDKTLTMTSANDAAEVSRFAQMQIPADVKEGSVVVVKSEEPAEGPVL